MDVFLATLGCRLNEAEIESWSRAFASAGHRVVPAPERAQVMVVNSCAVTTEAARKSRQLVSRAHRANPNAHLVVTGCYAELEPERVAALTGVDLVVPNTDKDALAAMVGDLDVTSMPTMATEADAEASHVYREARTRAFVKVQDGCRNRCTFCIVTVARGEERSRSIADIVAEINQLGALGYREAVLTGVHLGGYGSDLGVDLRALTEAVLADTDMPRVRLSSLEPWDLPAGFMSLLEHPRLMPHLHLPMQSGSDDVLRRMARRNTTAELEQLIADARAARDDVTITTDVIVGFPGETDAHWRETVDTVERIGFGHIHIFTYSVREGTTAARMPGHLPTAVKKARSRELHAIAARMKRAHLERFVGDTRDVLFEGDGAGGYTDNYLRVTVDAALGHCIAATRIVGVSTDGDELVGQVDDAPAHTPVRRLRVL